MTSREKRLLENLLDALDRLFDDQSTVIDVHDLLIATSDALSDTNHFLPLQESLPALEQFALVWARAARVLVDERPAPRGRMWLMRG